MQLNVEPRDEDNPHYEDLDDETQDVEIERTIANFMDLRNLDIRAELVDDVPRFMQALLKGITQNPSLRSLSMFHMDDFGLQELDSKASKLEKLEIGECNFSISTWKGLLSIPSLDNLELATLSGEDREELAGRIPHHVLSRQHAFRSLPEHCRSIRNLNIKWQETDIMDLEHMIRFFQFEKLTLDLRGLELGEDEPEPSPEEWQENFSRWQENFSRICGLIHPENSKVHFVFDSASTYTILYGFPELLRTILGFRAVVGMEIIVDGIEFFDHDLFSYDEHSSECLRVLTEHNGEENHLEALQISGFEVQEDDICKMIANFPRLQYLTASHWPRMYQAPYSNPTPTIAEAVDAHPNLHQLYFNLDCGSGDKILADRARDRIETSLLRNQANRFARRISSRTTCSETGGAGLKLWPTIFSNVDKGDVAAMSGIFQAFRNDMGSLLLGGDMVQQENQPPPSEMMQQENQPPPSKKMAGRRLSRKCKVPVRYTQ